MKRLFLFVSIFLFIGIYACNKEEDITDPDQFPKWLKSKITELTSEFNLCEYTDVTIIECNGERYYHIYCGAWSCSDCHIFNKNGNRPVWSVEQWNDFRTNKKVIRILPAC